MKSYVLIFKETWAAWKNDNVVILAAALSFFTIFSIVPILILTIALTGHFLGEEQAQITLLTHTANLTSPHIAETLKSFVEMGQHAGAGLASIFSGIILILVSSRVFIQLQKTLNIIWKVKEGKKGFLKTIKSRLLSFSMLLGIGGLVILILILDTIFQLTFHLVAQHFPQISSVLEVAKRFNILSFFLLGFASAAIYKYLPETKIAWRDVWMGGMLTAILFFFGRFLLTVYFSHSSLTNLYGAASSILILFLWIFYSSQIFFLGAEFSWAYAHQLGSRQKEEG